MDLPSTNTGPEEVDTTSSINCSTSGLPENVRIEVKPKLSVGSIDSEERG